MQLLRDAQGSGSRGRVQRQHALQQPPQRRPALFQPVQRRYTECLHRGLRIDTLHTRNELLLQAPRCQVVAHALSMHLNMWTHMECATHADTT